MHRHLLIAAIAALAACGNTSDSPAPDETPRKQAEKARPADPCADVALFQAARSDDPPFSSLRGDPVMLEDQPLEDNWYAKEKHFGAACHVAVMSEFFGGETDFHLIGCTLFSEPSSFDREENELRARTVLEDTRTMLEGCLGDGWVMEETDQHHKADIYQKYKFEPEGFETPYDFTADPIYLEMSYARFPGGGVPSGWQVNLQFQEQVASPAASEED